MIPVCILCREATDSTTLADLNRTVGPICPECTYWCDGNIIPTGGSGGSNAPMRADIDGAIADALTVAAVRSRVGFAS